MPWPNLINKYFLFNNHYNTRIFEDLPDFAIDFNEVEYELCGWMVIVNYFQKDQYQKWCNMIP